MIWTNKAFQILLGSNLPSSTKNTNLEFRGNKAKSFQVSQVFHELIPSLSKYVNAKTIPSIVKSTFKPYSITIVALVFSISNFFINKII